MTTENTKRAVDVIVKVFDETAIYEMIQEQKHDYIDQDDIDDFDGDFEMAYEERGRGSAESDVLNQIVRSCGVELTTDEFLEVYDTLQEIYMITAD